MLPIGPLMIEHRLIERMVGLIGLELERINKTGRADVDFLASAVDFMRTYADTCHHGKEEDILFRSLAKKPLSDGLRDTMEALIQEHVFARKTVAGLELARMNYHRGEKASLAEVGASLKTIARFYPQHIAKEDRHFFLPCMDYFTSGEKDAMLKEFVDFDSKLIHEKYKAIYGKLEGALKGP